MLYITNPIHRNIKRLSDKYQEKQAREELEKRIQEMKVVKR